MKPEVGFVVAGLLVFGAGVGLLATGRGSSATEPPRLSVSGAYMRPVGRSKDASAYLTIRNSGGADRLVGVRTDVSTAVMLGRPGNQFGAGMVMVNTVAVPAHGSVTFNPSGLAPMLMGIRHGLGPGDRVRLTLLFAQSAPVTVNVPVTRG